MSKGVGKWEGRCLQRREGGFRSPLAKGRGRLDTVSAKPYVHLGPMPKEEPGLHHRGERSHL